MEFKLFIWEIVNIGFSWENIFLITITSIFKDLTQRHFFLLSTTSAVSSLTLWFVAVDVGGGV